MLPWIRRLAPQHAVFAPDTPGFGYSDPLPLAQPTIADYAAAVAALITALGLPPVILFGIHTGAVIALRTAVDWPAQVEAVVCDGYARFDAEERSHLLSHYLPPFEPQWDGSHLLWLWARLREQYTFFPWHDGRQQARMALPPASPLGLHSDVMDVLSAGDGYRVGYRAPFLNDDPTAPLRLRVPSYLLYREKDVLASHRDRLPALPQGVQSETVTDGAAGLMDRVSALIDNHAGDCNHVAAAQCVVTAVAPTRRVTKRGLGLHLRPGDISKAVIVVNEPGTPAQIPNSVDPTAFVMAIEWPSHGSSLDALVDCSHPDAIVAALLDVREEFELDELAIIATGASAFLGLKLADCLGTRCRMLELESPLLLSDAQASALLARLPDTTPVPSGAHLIEAWNWARQKQLFWMWDTDAEGCVRKTSAPSPWKVHLDTIEILRAGPTHKLLWQTMLGMKKSRGSMDYPVRINSSSEREVLDMAAAFTELVNPQAASSLPPADGSRHRR